MGGDTQRKPRQRAWRECLFHALLLLVVLAALFPQVVFRGETLLPGAFLERFPPWREYPFEGVQPTHNDTAIEALLLFNTYYVATAMAVDNDEWPLWNPLAFGGIPLLAGYQSAAFYPPRLLHAFLDLYAATTLYILLKLWLCGMTAYWCARRLGLGTAAARFVSVGWMLSGYCIVWSYWADPDVAVWLPVLFLGAEFVLRGKYRPGFFAMASAATLLLLAGHPETAFTMGFGVGVYFCLRLAVERRWGSRLWAPVGIALAAWTAALLICAPQILPFLEYLANSQTFLHRPGDEAGRHAVWAGAVVSLFVPRFYGATTDGNFWAPGIQNYNFIGMAYAGIVVWLTVSLLAVRSRNRPKVERTRIVCLTAACALSILLAFDFPVLRLIRHLPVLNAMWVCWYVAFAMFALPLLGGIALDRWFSQPRRARELLSVAPVMGTAVAIAVVFYRTHHGFIQAQGQDEYVRQQVALAFVFAGLGLLFLAAHLAWKKPRVLANLLALVLLCDLFIAARGQHETSPRECLFVDTELTRYLQGLGAPTRVNVTSAGIPTGLLQPYGIEQQWGYDGILPERMYTFFGKLGGDIWNAAEPLCSIGYYLHDPDGKPTFPKDEPDRFALVTTLDGIEVYRNRRALPRAFVVGRLEAVPDIEELFARMRDPDFDPSRVALTASPPACPLPVTVAARVGTANVVQRTSTKVVLDVDCAERATLVLSDAYYPGWRAQVDEDEAEVFPVYYAFRGVVVPAGRHTVEFTYFPTSFSIGLGVSVLTLTVGLLAALRLLTIPRRAGGTRGNLGRET